MEAQDWHRDLKCISIFESGRKGAAELFKFPVNRGASSGNWSHVVKRNLREWVCLEVLN